MHRSALEVKKKYNLAALACIIKKNNVTLHAIFKRAL